MTAIEHSNSRGNFTIRRLTIDEAAERLAALADLLIDCVAGGASIGFLLPLSQEKALGYWRGVISGITGNERVLLIAEDDVGTVVGTVQLITDMPDNQPHRGEVSKLLVHRLARRQGLARRLLAAVDDAAREEKKTLLVLDTSTGSDAERLYEREGWVRVGIVPDFSLMPSGRLCGTTFFYKDL